MPTSPSNKPLVVITMGDPSGIGPEIILKSLKGASYRKCAVLIVGDKRSLEKESASIGMDMPHVNILDLRNVPQKGFKYGVIRRSFGEAALAYIRQACGIIMEERQRRKVALVTAPVNKEAINKYYPRFPGHTEYLAGATRSKFVTMLMVSKALKVALVSRHIPFSKVPRAITRDKIVMTTTEVHKALKNLFKIKSPRIGIASLNPHAGEGGIFGKEELQIIKPAADYLRNRIPNITGPEPSDTLFYKAYSGKLDAVVCMYHDQALIPFKMLGFDTGVNVTLGLPFIRTSPGHGTAFDIAGENSASPRSMIEAIDLAISFANS